ncbi:MAG: isochorismatase family protein [Betaproteobacteria bacterium]|nr:isochorismatase family protein [Betaproteobacteria bacterium]MCC7216857.1 isochorismatase family protein [Burkholderiales bacterium]
MLIDAERSTLLVVDLQEKMVPALADGATVVANARWLIGVARKVGVPVAGVAQYPQGLGPLVPEIAELLAADAVAAKTRFSCVAAGCLAGLPGAERAQFVLAGAETHVCVLQSALELVEDGKEVFVVADAVGSRRAFDRDVALWRMREEGVRIVTREMVAFEWLGEAGTALFRDVNREFLR